MTNRPPQAAAKPKVHVRGPVTLGSIARDISVPAATPRMCASPQVSCGGTGKLRWGSGQATGPRAVWMATVCNSGLSPLAWGWPPAWQPLPFWPRPRAVARRPSPPCAQLQLSARQPQPNRRQAALAGLHAVLRWRLRRGPSTCRRLSLTPGTLTLSRRAVLRVDQLAEFLRALGSSSAQSAVPPRTRQATFSLLA
jgi:hypothetical protein